MKANEILKENETAIIIFTSGINLEINEGGTSKSGVWRVNKNTSPEKVIIYFRNKSKNINEIFRGNFVQLLPSNEIKYPDRFIVEFDNTQSVGQTESNWLQFTNSRQGAVSPIRYIQ